MLAVATERTYPFSPGVTPPPGLPLRAPSGVTPPPGLPLRAPSGFRPPPGLPHPALGTHNGVASLSLAQLCQGQKLAACRTYNVLVRGLPNEVLSLPMVEAMLQQAGLKHATADVWTRKGNPCGEALITLRGARAAECCAKHFQGCQWAQSDTFVSVKISEQKQQPLPLPEAGLYGTVHGQQQQEPVLSAGAPKFGPFSRAVQHQQEPRRPATQKGTILSPDAPEFMPLLLASCPAMVSRPASDTSTDVGDRDGDGAASASEDRQSDSDRQAEELVGTKFVEEELDGKNTVDEEELADTKFTSGQEMQSFNWSSLPWRNAPQYAR